MRPPEVSGFIKVSVRRGKGNVFVIERDEKGSIDAYFLVYEKGKAVIIPTGWGISNKAQLFLSNNYTGCVFAARSRRLSGAMHLNIVSPEFEQIANEESKLYDKRLTSNMLSKILIDKRIDSNTRMRESYLERNNESSLDYQGMRRTVHDTFRTEEVPIYYHESSKDSLTNIIGAPSPDSKGWNFVKGPGIRKGGSSSTTDSVIKLATKDLSDLI